MSTLAQRPSESRRSPARPVRGEPTPPRFLARGLVAIALGLAAVSLLGPLATETIDYRLTETLRNQLIGLDAVSLFVVAPLSLFAAALVHRRHVAGPALALGIGAYTSYMFVQYVLGPDYGSIAGNNERLFPLALALFAGGWIVALAAWTSIDATRLPRSARHDRLVGRYLLPVLGLLAFARYVPSLADWMSASPQDEGYLAGPSFGWAIALLDLGVFLPITVAACAGLRRAADWAPKATYLVVGWFALVGPAVAAMAIAMSANDDPNASTGTLVFMVALGLVFAGLAAFLLRPLFRPEVRR